jgi:hypothetical protein
MLIISLSALKGVSLQFFGLAIFVFLLAESTHRYAQAHRDFPLPSSKDGLVRLDRLRGVWLYIAVARHLFRLG